MFHSVPASELHLQTKKTDTRLLSLLKESLTEADFILAGYADDEGIQNNSGRPGARLGPNKIREHLYKMTPPVFNPEKADIKLYDLGNIDLKMDLASRHEIAVSELQKKLQPHQKLLSLGGGHDYAYVDGKYFLNTQHSDLRPLIINFDAHLDVRPTDQGITSGTPFYRLLDEFKDFDFYEVGIQEQCNNRKHLDWLYEKGGQVISFNDLYENEATEITPDLQMARFKKIFEQEPLGSGRPCYISVDIDGFSNAYAMGCSQSFATGFSPSDFFQMFQFLLDRFDVKVLGIYEVSPPLDFDHITSKLAALIAYKYFYHQAVLLRSNNV